MLGAAHDDLSRGEDCSTLCAFTLLLQVLELEDGQVRDGTLRTHWHCQLSGSPW